MNIESAWVPVSAVKTPCAYYVDAVEVQSVNVNDVSAVVVVLVNFERVRFNVEGVTPSEQCSRRRECQ